MRLSPPGTNFIAESTEATRIKCLSEGHNILMLPWFEPSASVFRNCHLKHKTDMLHNCSFITGIDSAEFKVVKMISFLKIRQPKEQCTGRFVTILPIF